jgi:chaperonin GroEL
MRSTTAIHGKEAREALKRGINKVNAAVAPTLGAKGRNAVYSQYNSPVVTNDGVSIARQILPKDNAEYLGAELIKQAAERTNEEAGDGTSTTIILTNEMVNQGFEAIENGANPIVLRNEMEEAKKVVIEELKNHSTETDDLLSVAKVSVENDEIAELVSGVVQRVGKLGSILVEEGHLFKTEVEEVKGYWFERGYVSPYMITNEKNEAVLEDCAVILTDKSLNLNKDLFEVLSGLVNKGIKSALIVADKVEGELLQTLIANKLKGTIIAIAVNRPSSLEELEDIAVLTNAIAVTKDKGILNISAEHVGSSKKVIVKKNSTIIVGRDSKALTERITALEDVINNSKEKYGEIELSKERLARLTGGLAVIRVGAKTEAERGYWKLKIDDAVGACRAAAEEGVIAGGGSTLRKIADSLRENHIMTPGMTLVLDALCIPYKWLIKNSGMEGVDESKNYNVLTGEEVKDLKAIGIVDPTKVARCAIENAISTASTVLTTETVITVDEDLSLQKLKNLLA